jgi:hypothetical protein
MRCELRLLADSYENACCVLSKKREHGKRCCLIALANSGGFHAPGIRALDVDDDVAAYGMADVHASIVVPSAFNDPDLRTSDIFRWLVLAQPFEGRVS